MLRNWKVKEIRLEMIQLNKDIYLNNKQCVKTC